MTNTQRVAELLADMRQGGSLQVLSLQAHLVSDLVDLEIQERRELKTVADMVIDSRELVTGNANRDCNFYVCGMSCAFGDQVETVFCGQTPCWSNRKPNT